MGNREDLLAGAKRCLYEKGYARTTARDIAAASGVVSLAAIGYHYGSKEALLNAALLQALEEWGEDLGRILSAQVDPAATPRQRFEAAWTAVVRSFEENRPLWAVQFELVAHMDKTPELRQAFAESGRQARLGLAELIGDLGVGADEHTAEKIGALYQVMLSGLAAQWLVDPRAVPTGSDLVEVLQLLAGGLHPATGTTG
ncbi:TetR/AcrR family transcriptional regulator [Sphaerisporangium sp. NPDC005288]|uniref:TetR/AcrR family transcriptional regulator n=1 Tax=unclassified Sphaerisporangium TaxID=2630420 RepID=UPI0033A289D4